MHIPYGGVAATTLPNRSIITEFCEDLFKEFENITTAPGAQAALSALRTNIMNGKYLPK